MIYFDEISLNNENILLSMILNTNDRNASCYLPIICMNVNDNSESIVFFSIDEPYI